MILFLGACATTGNGTGDAAKQSLSKEEKAQSLQDVRSVDKTYSSNINLATTLEKVRTKYSCKEYRQLKKTAWKDLLEAGYSCIDQKKWIELSEIAKILSHNHLKAPWGPYYRSIVAENKRDFSRALWMINLAEKKAPENSIILYQKARLLWTMGDETESYKLMEKVVKLNPKNFDALFFLGKIQYRDREFADAIHYFEKVYRYKRKDAAFRASLAESYFFEKKYKKSIDHYKAAASGQELNASLFYKIGLAYKNLKKYDSAKNYFEKAISQRRKGRSLASFSDDKVRAELNQVIQILEKKKAGGSNEKNI